MQAWIDPRVVVNGLIAHTDGTEKFSKNPIGSVISQLWGGRTLVTRGLRPQLSHPAQKRVSNR